MLFHYLAGYIGTLMAISSNIDTCLQFKDLEVAKSPVASSRYLII
jgi:hypothetical protein